MEIAPKLGNRVDAVLQRLYAEDHEQRRLGLPTSQRTRNIDIESGRFLFLLALGMQAKQIVEIGSSNAVSTIWLGSAAKRTGGAVFGTELIPERAAEANRNLAQAGLDSVATVHPGPAADSLASVTGPFDLVFIDAEKDEYSNYFDRIVDRVRPGGLIVADNVTSHDCTVYQSMLRSRSDIETVTVTFERGFEISARI
jgi:predicted O-methyltransferase YrrM